MGSAEEPDPFWHRRWGICNMICGILQQGDDWCNTFSVRDARHFRTRFCRSANRFL